MTVENTQATSSLIGLTADVVVAYVSNNPVPTSQLSSLIAETHTAIATLAAGAKPEQPEEKPTPAVTIRKSVTRDFLICLEDGKKFKSLKRHLATHYDLTPDQYRQKWNLPADNPMVAPNYSASRSALAKTMGLGRKTSGCRSSAASRGQPEEDRAEVQLKAGGRVKAGSIQRPAGSIDQFATSRSITRHCSARSAMSAFCTTG
ncbi:hypothetical protein GCM10010869_06220 [Mesorhizobium tianshanense]|uniref:MucR family transcriptional regulator n=1 Tax=Mesorhizobium tianshanense TaxID=39844 RepID=A0A562NLL8_9HYPH|nr:MucR family transcriptional regulator [Mesorhizobium tianshanense]GLS35034.1 hypothetical protein GCM10010869_06220 [Mesorhizobium tianshanense]